MTQFLLERFSGAAGDDLFVGREAACRLLEAFAASVKSGGAAGVVTGEGPGIGKTALLHCSAQRCEVTVRWAQGDGSRGCTAVRGRGGFADATAAVLRRGSPVSAPGAGGGAGHGGRAPPNTLAISRGRAGCPRGRRRGQPAAGIRGRPPVGRCGVTSASAVRGPSLEDRAGRYALCLAGGGQRGIRRSRSSSAAPDRPAPGRVRGVGPPERAEHAASGAARACAGDRRQPAGRYRDAGAAERAFRNSRGRHGGRGRPPGPACLAEGARRHARTHPQRALRPRHRTSSGAARPAQPAREPGPEPSGPHAR